MNDQAGITQELPPKEPMKAHPGITLIKWFSGIARCLVWLITMALASLGATVFINASLRETVFDILRSVFTG